MVKLYLVCGGGALLGRLVYQWLSKAFEDLEPTTKWGIVQKLLLKTFDPAVGIKCIGLEWLGHVTSMEQTRVTKEIIQSKPESGKYVGRPRVRGLEDVDSDLWELKLQNGGGNRIAEDRGVKLSK
jgi:hypothetical protein